MKNCHSLNSGQTIGSNKQIITILTNLIQFFKELIFGSLTSTRHLFKLVESKLFDIDMRSYLRCLMWRCSYETWPFYDIDYQRSLKIIDIFVPPSISLLESKVQIDEQKIFDPQAILKKVLQEHRMLLILGEPGSGKTTLLKYYAICCCDSKMSKLLEIKTDLIPIHFFLREIDPKKSLTANLKKQCQKFGISENISYQWLQKRPILILLDGLDEVKQPWEMYREMYKWISNTARVFLKATFVITARVMLPPYPMHMTFSTHMMPPYLMDMVHRVHWEFSTPIIAQINGLSLVQQQGFLIKMFKVFYSCDNSFAVTRAERIITFLNEEDNKSIRELAAIPAFLSHPSIHGYYNIISFYDAVLNYLLADKEIRREYGEYEAYFHYAARYILSAIAFRAFRRQEESIPQQEMIFLMQNYLETYPLMRNWLEEYLFWPFWNYLARTELVIDNGKSICCNFRYKGIWEYLTSIWLLSNYTDYTDFQDTDLREVITCLEYKLWKEPIKLCIAQVKDRTFRFVFEQFLNSEFGREVGHVDDRFFEGALKQFWRSNFGDTLQQLKLKDLVKTLTFTKIELIASYLGDDRLNSNQRALILTILKIVGTEEALQYIKSYAEENKADDASLRYAQKIIFKKKT